MRTTPFPIHPSDQPFWMAMSSSPRGTLRAGERDCNVSFTGHVGAGRSGRRRARTEEGRSPRAVGVRPRAAGLCILYRTSSASATGVAWPRAHASELDGRVETKCRRRTHGDRARRLPGSPASSLSTKPPLALESAPISHRPSTLTRKPHLSLTALPTQHPTSMFASITRTTFRSPAVARSYASQPAKGVFAAMSELPPVRASARSRQSPPADSFELLPARPTCRGQGPRRRRGGRQPDGRVRQGPGCVSRCCARHPSSSSSISISQADTPLPSPCYGLASRQAVRKGDGRGRQADGQLAAVGRPAGRDARQGCSCGRGPDGVQPRRQCVPSRPPPQAQRFARS